MRIVLETKFRKFSVDSQVEVTAPYYKFINTGAQIAFIHNNFALFPQTEFGVNILTIAAAMAVRGIPVQNKTVYNLNFFNNSFFKEITLQETFIKLLP